MQNSTITTTVHRAEVEVSADWADEALALAHRVNRKLGQPAVATTPPLDEPEYEPQGLEEQPKPPGRKLRG